jgi:hypothetical protein
MRREARTTARNYAWRSIIENTLLTKLRYVAVRQDVRAPSAKCSPSSAYGGRAALNDAHELQLPEPPDPIEPATASPD